MGTAIKHVSMFQLSTMARQWFNAVEIRHADRRDALPDRMRKLHVHSLQDTRQLSRTMSHQSICPEIHRDSLNVTSQLGILLYSPFPRKRSGFITCSPVKYPSRGCTYVCYVDI